MTSKGAFHVLSFHFSSHTLSLISCVYLFSQSSVHGTNLANVRWTYKPSGLECCDMAGQVSKIAGQTSLQVSADSVADPGEGVYWVVSLPPLWGQISLKLWKGIELLLRRFCLLSGQSPPFQKSFSKILDLPLRLKVLCIKFFLVQVKLVCTCDEMVF